jgi:hypothetical protein
VLRSINWRSIQKLAPSATGGTRFIPAPSRTSWWCRKRITRSICEASTGARLFSQLRAFLGTSKITIRKTVLDRILPIPEDLVIEADEYIFTLAPAIAPAIILNQPLFYYRFHGNNLYMVQSGDLVKLRRKHGVLRALLRTLPAPLSQLGVSQEIINAVLEPIGIDAKRLKLSMDGGKPWDTFRVERAAYRLSYKGTSLGYRAFKAVVLLLTLLMPPRQFYRAKNWYAAKGLRRLRKVLGEPTPAAPILEGEPEP